MYPKNISSLKFFAQYPGWLPAVTWRLATGDWRLVYKIFNPSNK